MRVGRTIAVAVLGFLFMLFVALDLVLFGVVSLNSAVVTILPVAGLVLGVAVGIVAGDGEKATDDPTIQNGSPV
jgi:hypothetical protein